MVFSSSNASRKAGLFISFYLLRLAAGQPPPIFGTSTPNSGPIFFSSPTIAPVVATDIPTVGPSLAPITDAPVPLPTVAPTLAPVVTTSAPVTAAPSVRTTDAPVTLSPTLAPVTSAPVSSAPVTSSPTLAPVTSAPVSSTPTTSAPTRAPVTSAPVSSAPVTLSPTLVPVTSAPVSSAPVTSAPVSSAPVTSAPVSSAPVTLSPTLAPVTSAPVTSAPSDALITPTPTLRPSLAQQNITFAPTLSPVTAAPSSAPTFTPSTTAPTIAPSTTAPTFAPSTTAPTLAPVTPTSFPSSPAPVVATGTPTLAPADSTAPTSAPTVSAAPTPVATAAPSTSTPTSAPITAAPVSSAPTSAPVTAAPVSSAPTPGPTEIPSTSPSSEPSIIPSTSPSSEPSTGPTPIPTDSPVTPGQPTLSPVTAAPTNAPQSGPVRVQETFSGIRLTLEGVASLDTASTDVWETTTKTWFEEFYNGVIGRRHLVFGDGIDGVDTMETTVTYRDQEAVAADASANREFPQLTIIYDQEITYFATSVAPTPREIIVVPFEDTDGNAMYAADLQTSNDPAFALVQSPIESPIIPGAGDDDDGLSTGAIVGIAVAGGFVFLMAAFLGIRMMGSDDGEGYVDPDTRPPGQFNVAASDDVSAIDDAPAKALGAGDASVAEYGDQSVATVDYDYSKAYGGGGDTSVVSSAGGTFGDNTRQSTGDIAASAAARTALGASFDSESQFQSNVKEEVLVINAPPGKLGVVIDTPDDGAPVVHAVKDSSVIADQIRVGDKLVAVDNEDVRSLTAIKVSKLISRKGANASRKLTVVRTTVVEGP